jgi:glycine C-acetyltransferase
MTTGTTYSNASMRQFYRLHKRPLSVRAQQFSAYFRSELDSGFPLFREVCSPAANRVMVRDRVSSKVREMVMFGSNNYLSLANNAEVAKRLPGYIEEFGTGLGGPPLLNGTTTLHRRLEASLAALKGTEDAVLFSSGFAANYGMVRAITSKSDVLILDELCHASLREAASTSGATVRTFQHSNVADLEVALRSPAAVAASTRIVVVEGVYSMDGDVAPLDKVVQVTREADGFLIVDDAHGTGVLGAHGRGAAEQFGVEGQVDLVMGTFSKALAASGGFVAGRRDVIDYIRFFANPYFFSASMPPSLIAQVLVSLEVAKESPWLRTRLFENVAYIKRGLAALGLPHASDSAIIPLAVPSSVRIRDMAREFDAAGVFINHVEYPAVSSDKQRFRISAMSTHTKEDMDLLLDTIENVFRSHGLLP